MMLKSKFIKYTASNKLLKNKKKTLIFLLEVESIFFHHCQKKHVNLKLKIFSNFTNYDRFHSENLYI